VGLRKPHLPNKIFEAASDYVACGWFVACGSGLCRGSEEGDICWFVGMMGMVGFDSLDALSWV